MIRTSTELVRQKLRRAHSANQPVELESLFAERHNQRIPPPLARRPLPRTAHSSRRRAALQRIRHPTGSELHPSMHQTTD
jgi:hypothetical protein